MRASLSPSQRLQANQITSGAFTPGCQAYHVPPYIEKIGDLQAKGIDAVYIIAFNDAFVMNAWGKVNKANGKPVVRVLTSALRTLI